MRFLMILKSGLNIFVSCVTTSSTSCWCGSTLRLFIVRTMAASMAYLLSLSTSSSTFFFSSTGGIGTLILLARSVNLALYAKTSFAGSIVRPSGVLVRILYFAQLSECSVRVTSSSGRLSRSRISANARLSSELNSSSVAAWNGVTCRSIGFAAKFPRACTIPSE